MSNDKQMTEMAIARLIQAWDSFLESLMMAVMNIERNLLSDEEYFRTAAKKGKTQQQISNRNREYERRLRDLTYYTTEFEHYTCVNNCIIAGYIKPYCIKTVDSFQNTLGVDAYYFVDMPDGKAGFFSDGFPIVREATNFKYR